MHRLIRGIQSGILCFILLAAAANAMPPSETDWVEQLANLYLQSEIPEKDQAAIFSIIENRLGIREDGTLDLMQSWNTRAQLARYENDSENEFYNLYFEDKLSLIGLNYIYFEICTLYGKKERFIRYFINGYTPNKALFPENRQYYKILYYYLYNVQDHLIQQISGTMEVMNQKPPGKPLLTAHDIELLSATVLACTQLDTLDNSGTPVEGGESLFSKVFDEKEQEWIRSTVQWFSGVDTHYAINSYEWCRKNIPLSITGDMIGHRIATDWQKQSLLQRSRLPLMFFSVGEDAAFTIDPLFLSTLELLKLDNREIDLLALSALKAWVSRQVRQGIRVSDRVKYDQILKELKVCPTGWVFYNLYACRQELDTLKQHAENWHNLSADQQAEIFEKEIKPTYYTATGKIDSVMGDLEKIFGKRHTYGQQLKSASINPIFHRYKGEVDYYYEYLHFALIESKNIHTIRLPLSGSRQNCLNEFTAAFVKDKTDKRNHLNLLNAYNLLFRELVRQGDIVRITKHEKQLITLLDAGEGLGNALTHQENNTYDIYQLIAETYLTHPQFQNRALEIARRSYGLARQYYATAAEEHGFVHDGRIGAINNGCTEVDDFERQYEFYRSVAEKLGKKVQLLLPPEDVRLYNKLQELKEARGFTI